MANTTAVTTSTQRLIAYTARCNGWTTRDPNPARAITIAWKRDATTVILDFDRKTGRILTVDVSGEGQWKGAGKSARLLALLESRRSVAR